MKWWQRRFILRAYALELTPADKHFFRAMQHMVENKAILQSVQDGGR